MFKDKTEHSNYISIDIKYVYKKEIKHCNSTHFGSVAAFCCSLYCSSLHPLFLWPLNTAVAPADHQRGVVNYRDGCQRPLFIVVLDLQLLRSFCEWRNVLFFVQEEGKEKE